MPGSLDIRKLVLLRTLVVLVFVISVAVSLSFSRADGNIYYVAPVAFGGSDLHSGSITEPWATLSYAAATATAGDTVYVAAGTYNENVTINTGINLICSTSQSCTTLSFVLAGNGANVDGFHSLYSEATYGAFIVSGSGNTIQNNLIEHACMTGIEIRGNNNLALNNEISASRQCPAVGSDADGIRIFDDGNIARGNYIHDISYTENPTAHIDCFQSWGTLTNATIENNFCNNLEAISSNPTAKSGMQIDVGNVHNVTIKNNVFRVMRGLNIRGEGFNIINNVFVGDNYPSTYVFLDSISNATFKNNIVFNTTHGIIVAPDYSAEMTGGYNIFYNDNAVAPIRDSAYYAVTDHWQTLDPSFVAPASYNFHLQTGAPACTLGEAGTYVGAYPCTTPTPTVTVTPTATVTPTLTLTPIPTNTITVTPTLTLTPSPTNSNTPTPTLTLTPTNTITVTPMVTVTATLTPTITLTPTFSPAPTNTLTVTPTVSTTVTVTPTTTLTTTPTLTPTSGVTTTSNATVSPTVKLTTMPETGNPEGTDTSVYWWAGGITVVSLVPVSYWLLRRKGVFS